MKLSADMLAVVTEAALGLFGRHHPLTQALHLAMVDPTDLEDVRTALRELPERSHKILAAAVSERLLPGS